MWDEKESQKETYKFFYDLNEEIKKLLTSYTSKKITNWDLENALWSYKGNPNQDSKKTQKPEIDFKKVEQKITINPTFNIKESLLNEE